MFSAWTGRARSASPPANTGQATLNWFGDGRLNEPTSTEYGSAKAGIERLVETLTSALDAIDANIATWKQLAKNNVTFSSAIAGAGFEDSSPLSHDVKRTEKVCQKLFVAVAQRSAEDEIFQDALLLVRRFLCHVLAIQARYRDISKSKTEFESCAAKVRNMENKQNVNRDALERANSRLKTSKVLYTAMIDRMIERMQEANSRKQDVLRTVHFLYWLVQARMFKSFEACTDEQRSKALTVEPLLCASTISFCSGLLPPASMFNGMDLRTNR